MNAQFYEKEPMKEGFRKRNQGRFMYDNKSDEMMCNVLQLYPNKKQNIFLGKEGEIKRQKLYKKVRDKFSSFAEYENEEFAEFGKGRGKKLFKKIGKGLKKVGRVIARGTLVIPRSAFLSLVRLNFRGSASRFNLLNEKGKQKLNEKWEKLGGKLDALDRAISKGKGKHPLACGKKCRSKAGKNPQLPNDLESEFVNMEPTTLSAIIASGGAVLTSAVKSIGDKSNYKSQIELAKIEQEIKEAENKEKKIDAQMTPQEQAIADEIIKAQESGFDSVKAIMENPNLTADEKKAALLELQESLGNNKSLFSAKNIVIGAVILSAIGFGLYYMSKNKN
ncbi:MAG: hypothetical protein EBQ89_03445 [Alphaproteobacteria bacterium]|nr:hypothetical protein [Alphaproteobacteria bacterium]